MQIPFKSIFDRTKSFCKIYSNFWQQVQTNWRVTDLKVIKSHINSSLKWYSNYEILCKCKIFIFFQYFLKEDFKFCGALLLHYVFWVKRKEKNRLKWILLPWLTGFHCSKLGILNLLEEKEDGIFIDPNYIKSMFFYKHFHTIISILFLKITILL